MFRKFRRFNLLKEDIGVDGQIMDHVTDADLEQDFGIKVRLHRVKIIEGIKKLQSEVPTQAEVVNAVDQPMQ